MITFCSRQDVFYIAPPKINRTVEQLQIMAETSSVSHPTSRKMTFCPAGGKKLCATNVMCQRSSWTAILGLAWPSIS